jgi:hypothetical protein
MDHLEVVKLMEGKGGKVWEDGQVRGAAAAAAAETAAAAADCRAAGGAAAPAILAAACAEEWGCSDWRCFVSGCSQDSQHSARSGEASLLLAPC